MILLSAKKDCQSAIIALWDCFKAKIMIYYQWLGGFLIWNNGMLNYHNI